jgi:hypothetical protein
MADIKIAHQDAPIVDGMIQGTVTVAAHINFLDIISFEKAIKKGLNPEKWEESEKANGNKILIEGIPYKEYKK